MLWAFAQTFSAPERSAGEMDWKFVGQAVGIGVVAGIVAALLIVWLGP